jgi:hypothetical protein
LPSSNHPFGDSGASLNSSDAIPVAPVAFRGGTNVSTRSYKRLGQVTRERGSHKRLRRIRWRESMSVEVWIFVIGMLVLLLFGIPWLVAHSPPHHH